MTGKQWVESHGVFSYGELPKLHPQLPPAVYELGFDPFRGQFVLEKIGDQFQLPEKIYNLEEDFIQRVLKTYMGLDKNFGILLKGLKGTGKTIVAKLICNRLKAPVILVTKPWKDMANFINSIDQDIIMLFDEFEKIYEFYSFGGLRNEEDEDMPVQPNENMGVQNVSNLLMLMDGVFTSTHKRLFIMTTNKDYLPDPMIARPSRVRYVKDFKDLGKEAILEILNDTVKNKELIDPLVDMLKQLEIITVDIVKAIAEEANLFNTADPDFYNIFNVKRQEHHYDFYQIMKGKKEKLLATNELFYPDRVRKGNYLQLNDGETFVGTISKHDRDNHILTLVNNRNRKTDRKPVSTTVTVVYRRSLISHYSFMA